MLKVKRLKRDNQGRPRLQGVETKNIYSDISLGKAEHHLPGYRIFTGGFNELNIPGDWHIVCPAGEPDYPLPLGIEFELVGEPTP